MKVLQFAIAALLPLLAFCRVLPPSPQPYIPSNATSLDPYYDTILDSQPSQLSAAAHTIPQARPQTAWQKYVCRGQKLHQACIHDKDQAREFVLPVDSSFDGTLEQELALWGYHERSSEAAPYCWFDKYISNELRALNIDPRGKDSGGPNECFRFEHYDKTARDESGRIPIVKQEYTVNSKMYRVSSSRNILMPSDSTHRLPWLMQLLE